MTRSGSNPRPECLLCNFVRQDPEYGGMAENDLAYIRTDPWSPPENLNAIVVPKRHESSFFGLAPREVIAVRGLAHAYRDLVAVTHGSAEFNLGSDVGPAAGQLGGHTYWLMAPRFEGDLGPGRTARGGVRWVIPEAGDYLAKGAATPGVGIEPPVRPAVPDIGVAPTTRSETS